MIALPFIDAMKNVSMFNNRNKILELINFYSQPFDIRMMVNLCGEKPDPQMSSREYVTRDMASDACDPSLEGSLYNDEECLNEAEIQEWQEAEDRVLFYNAPTLKYLRIRDITTFVGDLDSFLKLHKYINLGWKQSIVDKYFKQTK